MHKWLGFRLDVGGNTERFLQETCRVNPDAPILRLRWIEDGLWFEMAKFGGVESIAYLNAEGMIALAESMTYAP